MESIFSKQDISGWPACDFILTDLRVVAGRHAVPARVAPQGLLIMPCLHAASERLVTDGRGEEEVLAGVEAVLVLELAVLDPGVRPLLKADVPVLDHQRNRNE